MTFSVTVQPSGRRFEVERDEPVLAAAIRQGVGLPYGCKDGACGTCKSRLLEGRVIHGVHQHKALSEQEEGYNLVPLTDMVFNLLIFFMCATTFAQVERELSVQLPRTSASFHAPGRR